jgi:signal transduction histidine kinase
MTETLHFKTNTLLKNLVGKDLINDDNIAVVELIKNAYDAGSKSASIIFDNLINSESGKSGPRIVIVDQGSGMNIQDIKDKWLNIAYSDKKVKQREHGASFAGNKGIGRFSCDRLGERLDLLTRGKDEPILHLAISWPDFETEGEINLTIQAINVQVREVGEPQAVALTGHPLPAHGTILVISALRSSWDRNRLLDLKRTLERFLNPNQLFSHQTFTIHLKAPDMLASDKGCQYQDQVNGTVKNQIFANLEFKSTFIESAIDKDGKTISTILSHEGEPVFRLTERNETPLKDVKAFLYYLNPYKKAYFKRQTGMRSIDFGSTFLFLNGFRVAPYGDRGDDWLGLDIRKSQGQQRYLSSRDIVGRIEIQDNEDNFKPISSREGLKSTPAFRALKEQFALDVVRRLEKFVVDGLDWDSIPARLRNSVRAEEGMDWNDTPEEYVESSEKKRQRIALSIMSFIGSSPDTIINFWFNPSLLEDASERRAEEVSAVLDQIDAFEPGQVDRDLRSSMKQIRSILQKKEEEASLAKGEAAGLRVDLAQRKREVRDLKEQTETFRAQTLFLESVASIDVRRLMAFHHEIALNASIIDNYLGKAMGALRETPGNRALISFLEKISLANKRVTAIAQYATKANFKSATTREMTDVPSFIEQYIDNVARDFIGSGLNVLVENGVHGPFEIKLRRLELTIVVDNLISNSIKAQASNLKVTIEQPGPNLVRVKFSDDGRGLAAAFSDDPQKIFELGITTTSGSGMGLYHAKQIVEGFGGVINAVPLKQGLAIVFEVLR